MSDEKKRPPFHVCVKNKDGTPIEFTDYKGEKRKGTYAKIGALFPSRVGSGYDLALERKVTLDPAKHYVSVFDNSERGQQRSEKQDPGGDESEDLFK